MSSGPLGATLEDELQQATLFKQTCVFRYTNCVANLLSQLYAGVCKSSLATSAMIDVLMAEV